MTRVCRFSRTNRARRLVYQVSQLSQANWAEGFEMLGGSSFLFGGVRGRVTGGVHEVTSDREPADLSALGSSTAHTSMAWRQRVRKWHPLGGSWERGCRPPGRCAVVVGPGRCWGKPRGGPVYRDGGPSRRALHRSFLDDPPQIHDGHSVAEGTHEIEVVGDEQVGDPQRSWRSARRSTTCTWVATSSELSGSSSAKQFGFGRQGSGDGRPLQLSAGDLAGTASGEGCRETNLVE